MYRQRQMNKNRTKLFSKFVPRHNHQSYAKSLPLFEGGLCFPQQEMQSTLQFMCSSHVPALC